MRREFDVVLARSVDRLGRSLQDLVSFLSEIHAAGVDLCQFRQLPMLANDLVQRQASEHTLEDAFATIVKLGADALAVGAYSSLDNNGEKIVALTAQHKSPAIYPAPGYVRGGLMSYGADIVTTFREVALQYVGPILKGSSAAELPIQQATKFELAINLKAAMGLGLEVSPTLLALADEVIE